MKPQPQHHYLPDAAEHLTKELDKKHTLESIFSLAEQGLLAIGFKRIYNPNFDEDDEPKYLFLEHGDIENFSPYKNNKDWCHSVTDLSKEVDSRKLNYLHSIGDTDSYENYLGNELSPLKMREVKRNELLITHKELTLYIQEQNNLQTAFTFDNVTYIPIKTLVDIFENDSYYPKIAKEILTAVDRKSTLHDSTLIEDLFNYWTDSKQLNTYLDGELVDTLSIKLFPVTNSPNGKKDYNPALTYIEDKLSIDKTELIKFLGHREIKIPSEIITEKSDQLEQQSSTSEPHLANENDVPWYAILNDIMWKDSSLTINEIRFKFKNHDDVEELIQEGDTWSVKFKSGTTITKKSIENRASRIRSGKVKLYRP